MSNRKKHKKKVQQRRGLTGSLALAAAAAAKRKVGPIIVDPNRVELVGHEVIAPEEIGGLKVARVGEVPGGYQRPRDTRQINHLIAVIQSGGFVPDSVTVSMRAGERWIVEGQQRAEAHRLMSKPLRAEVYRCKHIDDEHGLFLVLDAKKKIKSDTVVAADRGFVGRLLMAANDDPQGLLFHQMSFGSHGGRLFSATPMARAVARVGLGMAHFERAEEWLRRASLEFMTNQRAKVRASKFLDLAMLVFGTPDTPVRARTQWIEALAIVAHERWKHGTPMPNGRVMRSLRLLHWTELVPSPQGRFMPLVVAEIQKKWKASRPTD